jgi:hypothetical protein
MSNYVYAATVLTGGGTGALDAIDGAGLADLDIAMVVTPTGTYIYSLDADSALAESSPYVISPDSNAGNKRWVLSSENNLVTSSATNLLTQSSSNGGPVMTTTYTKVMEYVVPHPGVYNIKFTLQCGGWTSYGRIYKNGVAVGTERTNADSDNPATFNEEISGWLQGDLLQIYIKNSNPSGQSTITSLIMYGVDPTAWRRSV